MKLLCALLLASIIPTSAKATDYSVGPNQLLTNISDVPWDGLQAGDRVFIHWRSTPYNEKWVINAQGTANSHIEIFGVPGPNGEKPIIDGSGAVTPTYLDYWGESRGVIKIGGSSVPSDALPSFIEISGLDIRSGRPAYQFTNDNGQQETYSSNAASIYVEKGAHVSIVDCDIHDSGNGIFIGAFDGATEDIVIAGCYIYDNGIVGSFYEHNTYTSAIGITYAFNRFGPLRAGCDGNNLKDRSAGLTVRCNWIEGGNRQLDLVEANGIPAVVNHPSYNETNVYGNILIEPDGAGNPQIIHYGGDNGNTADYRKGTLNFYNNTVISTRNGNTTLVRLSTQDETMMAYNNVIYVTSNGANLAMTNDEGTINLGHNWINTGWVNSHSGSISGVVNDLGTNLNGTDPLFVDFASQDFHPVDNSPLENAGIDIPNPQLPNQNVTLEYVKHSNIASRPINGNLDIGAFENPGNVSLAELTEGDVKVYPNPTNDKIYVEATGIQSGLMKLFDVNGRFLMETHFDSFDVSKLQAGTYYIELEGKSGMRMYPFVKM